MSMFNDFAFAAVDTFLKSEVQKMIDKWLSENGVDQLVGMIPNSGRPLPMPVKGILLADLTEIEIAYTGTAMRKTQDRVVKLQDQKKELPFERILPAKKFDKVFENLVEKDPVSGDISLSTTVKFGGIGISEGMGGIRAEVNGISFRADLKLIFNQKG